MPAVSPLTLRSMAEQRLSRKGPEAAFIGSVLPVSFRNKVSLSPPFYYLLKSLAPSPVSPGVLGLPGSPCWAHPLLQTGDHTSGGRASLHRQHPALTAAPSALASASDFLQRIMGAAGPDQTLGGKEGGPVTGTREEGYPGSSLSFQAP